MDQVEARRIIDTTMHYLERMTFCYGIPINDISDNELYQDSCDWTDRDVLSINDVPFTLAEILTLNTWDEWIAAFIQKAKEKGMLTVMAAEDYYRDCCTQGWAWDMNHTESEGLVAKIAANEEKIAAIRDRVELTGAYECNLWGRDLRREEVALIRAMGKDAIHVLEQFTDLCGREHVRLYDRLKDLMKRELENRLKENRLP